MRITDFFKPYNSRNSESVPKEVPRIEFVSPSKKKPKTDNTQNTNVI